jgi:hypothetical protein
LINSTSLVLPSCCSLSGGQHHHQLPDGTLSGHTSASNALHCCSVATGASGLARSARDYLQYIYPIIQLGIMCDNIHLVDCDRLLAECKISNALHQIGQLDSQAPDSLEGTKLA